MNIHELALSLHVGSSYVSYCINIDNELESIGLFKVVDMDIDEETITTHDMFRNKEDKNFIEDLIRMHDSEDETFIMLDVVHAALPAEFIFEATLRGDFRIVLSEYFGLQGVVNAKGIMELKV